MNAVGLKKKIERILEKSLNPYNNDPLLRVACVPPGENSADLDAHAGSIPVGGEVI